jgi:hypothetical protein
MEPDSHILNRSDYKFCALWSVGIASALVAAIGTSVFVNPSVYNDPGIFSVAAPFIFLGGFIPSFVAFMIGRTVWKGRRKLPSYSPRNAETDPEDA